jgi:peptidoglycan/LPS O-acetylase OafA/YrhL
MTASHSVKSGRILPLTSLRFFAAFYVVLYHSCTATSGPTDYSSWVGRFLGTGYVSVSFFFTLSGYILAIVYLRTGSLNRRSFWIARFARVYPLFWLMLVLDTPTLFFARLAKYGLMSAIGKTSITFVGNCLMLQSWTGALMGINDPSWSLSVETFFYLLFPLIGVALWRLSFISAWYALAAVYMFGLAAVSVSGGAGINQETVRFNPLFHVHEFAGGILIARLQVDFPVKLTAMFNRFGLTIATLSLFVFLLAVQFKEHVSLLLIHCGLFLPLYALVIWAFAGENRLISALFAPAWLVLLGEASYGLYLIHVPVLHVYEHLSASSRGNWLIYSGYLACTIGLSVIAFHFVETPARRAILRRFGTSSKETTLTSSLAQ